MKNDKSRRALKFPAAQLAMLGVRTIEYTPDRDRPKPPGSAWPAYYELFDQAYAMFDDGDTDRPAPHPEVIDKALTWCLWCKPLWDPTRDRREWTLFRMYALGMAVQGTKHRLYPNKSVQFVHGILDRLFHEIEVEAYKNSEGMTG